MVRVILSQLFRVMSVPCLLLQVVRRELVSQYTSVTVLQGNLLLWVPAIPTSSLCPPTLVYAGTELYKEMVVFQSVRRKLVRTSVWLGPNSNEGEGTDGGEHVKCTSV